MVWTPRKTRGVLAVHWEGRGSSKITQTTEEQRTQQFGLQFVNMIPKLAHLEGFKFEDVRRQNPLVHFDRAMSWELVETQSQREPWDSRGSYETRQVQSEYTPRRRIQAVDEGSTALAERVRELLLHGPADATRTEVRKRKYLVGVELGLACMGPAQRVKVEDLMRVLARAELEDEAARGGDEQAGSQRLQRTNKRRRWRKGYCGQPGRTSAALRAYIIVFGGNIISTALNQPITERRGRSWASSRPWRSSSSSSSPTVLALHACAHRTSVCRRAGAAVIGRPVSGGRWDARRRMGEAGVGQREDEGEQREVVLHAQNDVHERGEQVGYGWLPGKAAVLGLAMWMYKLASVLGGVPRYIGSEGVGGGWGDEGQGVEGKKEWRRGEREITEGNKQGKRVQVSEGEREDERRPEKGGNRGTTSESKIKYAL
ncbi:hypothetical protein C8J57DRAFT_1257319 [Mycena rebaudengoi]|nr:hypothetical protein C8J57DRAFT_1257319 [Mycena rebaudengoi]